MQFCCTKIDSLSLTSQKKGKKNEEIKEMGKNGRKDYENSKCLYGLWLLEVYDVISNDKYPKFILFA